MKHVPGTAGYERSIDEFVTRSQALRFEAVCEDFLNFLPAAMPASILDVGAGAGQNAYALAQRGYRVTAIEPMEEFVAAAKATYADKHIEWANDSLPILNSQVTRESHYNLILAEGMWHHLNEVEQDASMSRLATLLKPGGVLALSLRNGPAGMGTHIHPTDATRIVAKSSTLDLRCIFRREHLPSIHKHKAGVTWARLVFQK